MKKATCTLQKLYPVSKCDDGDNVFHSVLLSKTLTPLTPFVTPSVQFLSKEKPFCRRVLITDTVITKQPACVDTEP